MLNVSENKDAARRDRLIALLDSPMAQQLSEQLAQADSATAVRAKAREDLARLDERYRARVADLEPRVVTARQASEEAKRDYEAKSLESGRLGDQLLNLRHSHASERKALQDIATGSEAFLSARGLI